MSDTDEPDPKRDHLSKSFTPDWQGPVIVEDVRAACCSAHGDSLPRDDRPCMWLHNVLTKSEREALLHATGAYYKREKCHSVEPGVRQQFTSNDPGLSTLLWRRIKPFLPEAVDGGTAIGPMPRITHSRYLPGQSGFPHMDFRHGDPGKDATIASRVSLTVYLNDDYAGGELGFLGALHDDGSVSQEHSRVKPRAGSAVLFYQCVPQFAHVPHAVSAGSKKILRADIMYQFASPAAADVGGLRIEHLS